MSEETATATAEKPATPPADAKSLPATRPVGTVGPVRMGLAPQSFDEGWRMASLMAQSELVPKNFRNKPADVLVAMEMGIELGLPPMQALQSIAVINGRPSIWGDGFLALLMASPSYIDHDEYYEVDGKRVDGLAPDDLKADKSTAVCTFIRRNKATPVTRRFSIAQAKKASLWGKEGPWQTYPDRMLMMRARSWAGRDCFPDVLRGIGTSEEAMDAPPEIFEATLPPPKEPQRLSAAATTPAPVRASEPAGAVADPAAVPDAPAASEEIVLGPVGVRDAEIRRPANQEAFCIVTLTDGTKVETIDMRAAMELEQFKGTDHKIRLTCVATPVGVSPNTYELKSFTIAD